MIQATYNSTVPSSRAPSSVAKENKSFSRITNNICFDGNNHHYKCVLQLDAKTKMCLLMSILLSEYVDIIL